MGACGTCATRRISRGASATRCTTTGSSSPAATASTATSCSRRTAWSERRGVNIVDWEAETPAARRDLLLAALDWGRFVEINTWAAALPEGARDLLRDARFVPVDRGPLMRQGTRLLVRALGGGGADLALGDHRLLDAASWDMRMIYSMAG